MQLGDLRLRSPRRGRDTQRAARLAWHRRILGLKIALFSSGLAALAIVFASRLPAWRDGAVSLLAAAAASGAVGAARSWLDRSQLLQVKPKIKTYIWRNTCSHAAGSDHLEKHVPPRCVCWKPSPRAAIVSTHCRINPL